MLWDLPQPLLPVIFALGAIGSISVSALANAERRIPVVDLHVDVSYQVNYKQRRIGQLTGQFVADVLLTAGVIGTVLPLYVPNDVSSDGPRLSDLESSWAKMASLVAETAPYSGVGCATDSRRVATWFAFEGAAPFAGHPELVAEWVARGVRIWGLVHVHDNALATSAGVGPRRLVHDVGLTRAGHDLVKAIHAAGAFVDVSHASDRAIADILEHARRDHVPVIATHSNANRLAPHARNLTDAQLHAIAQTGGVVGVNFHGKFLAQHRAATLEDVVGQIRYLIGLVGVEHVAIGSDFEGGIHPPRALRDVRGYQVLGRALRRAGLSDTDVRLVFASNVLRLLGCASEQ